MHPWFSAQALMSAAAAYSAGFGAPKSGARMSNRRVNMTTPLSRIELAGNLKNAPTASGRAASPIT
jgi:hypothetical protein